MDVLTCSTLQRTYGTRKVELQILTTVQQVASDRLQNDKVKFSSDEFNLDFAFCYLIKEKLPRLIDKFAPSEQHFSPPATECLPSEYTSCPSFFLNFSF